MDYPQEVVEKTVFEIEALGDIYMKSLANTYLIEIEDNPSLTKKFYTELAHNDLRYQISKQSDTLRKLIIGRALFDTCLRIEK